MASSSNSLPLATLHAFLWSSAPHITAVQAQPQVQDLFVESVEGGGRFGRSAEFTSAYACPHWAKEFKVFKTNPSSPLDWVSAANMCKTHLMSGQRGQLATIRSSDDWAALKQVLNNDDSWRTASANMYAAWIGAWRPDSSGYQWIGQPKEPAFCDPSAFYLNWPTGQDEGYKCAKITKENTLHSTECTNVQLQYYVCEFCNADAPTDPCESEPTQPPPPPTPTPPPPTDRPGANYGDHNYRPCNSGSESIQYKLVTPTVVAALPWYSAELLCLSASHLPTDQQAGTLILPSEAIPGTSALATVRNYAEWVKYSAVFPSTSDRAWVGARWSGQGPDSVWMPPPQTGVEPPSFPWMPGTEPNPYGGGNCVSGSMLGAFTGDCDVNRMYVCQYCVVSDGGPGPGPGPVSPPTPHHPGCQHNEIKKYEPFLSMSKTWAEAQQYCVSKQGGYASTSVCQRSISRVARHEDHGSESETTSGWEPCRIHSAGLATVESHAEQHTLDDIGMDMLVWLGGIRTDTDVEGYAKHAEGHGDWMWSTGETITDFFWGPYQPTNQEGEGCLALHAADGSGAPYSGNGRRQTDTRNRRGNKMSPHHVSRPAPHGRAAPQSLLSTRQAHLRHSTSEGTWQDENCLVSLPFVCEYCVPAPPRPSCPSGTVKEYESFSTPLTWDAARQDCEIGKVRRAGVRHSVIKGVLATVESASDFAYLDSLTHDRLWIGGNDKAVDGQWVWTSGEYITEDYWGQSQPSSGGACMAIDASGQHRHTPGLPGHWYTEDCLEELPYVCQFCKVPTPNYPSTCEHGHELNDLNNTCVPCVRDNTIDFADEPGCFPKRCENRYEVKNKVCKPCSAPYTIEFENMQGCVPKTCISGSQPLNGVCTGTCPNRHELIDGVCEPCSAPYTIEFENMQGCVPKTCDGTAQIVNGNCTPPTTFSCTCFGKEAGFYPILKATNVIIREIPVNPNSISVYCDGDGNALIQNQAFSKCLNLGYGAVNSRLGPDDCGYLALEFVQELARESESVKIVDEAVGTMEAMGSELNTPLRALQDATSWQSDIITAQFTTVTGTAFNFDNGCNTAAEVAYGWPNMFNSCECDDVSAEEDFSSTTFFKNSQQRMSPLPSPCVNWNRVNRHSATTAVAENSATLLRMRDTNEMCTGNFELDIDGRSQLDELDPIADRVPRSSPLKRDTPRRFPRGWRPKSDRRRKPLPDSGRMSRSRRNRAVSELEDAAGSTTANDNNGSSCTVGGMPCWALYVMICGVVITGVAGVLVVWRMKKNKKQNQVVNAVAATTMTEIKSAH